MRPKWASGSQLLAQGGVGAALRVVSGCALIPHEAPMTRHSILGLPLLVLLACAGQPDAEERLDPGLSSGGSASSTFQGDAGASGGSPNGGQTAYASGGLSDDTYRDPDTTSSGGERAGGGGAGEGPGIDPFDPLGEQRLELAQKLAEVTDWDAAAFGAATRLTFGTLDYDPTQSIGLDTIQRSDLAMNEPELAKFQENGFVVSTDNAFPTFAYGYHSIYAMDLPVYVSADSILYAMHRSFDDMLKGLEEGVLWDHLLTLLSRLRGKLAASDLTDETRGDLDLYLTVAEGLAKGEALAPLDSSNVEGATQLFTSALAASGQGEANLFGQTRSMDFSQFKPRGHYTDSDVLSNYFRAMMWLGRVDFRLMEPNEAGELILQRRQVVATIALRALMDDEARSSYDTIDSVVSAFIGMQDYMTAPQVDDLMAALNIATASELEQVSDETLVQALRSGAYGLQQISSHVLKGGLGEAGTTPLPPAFALLGQRYVIDSHVFSNVVFDRVTSEPKRMLPNPLDVAYAALQNDQAGMLLAGELQTYDYASDLQSMRVLVDTEPAETWEKNLYHRWLGALRTLSPAQAWRTADDESLPGIATTEAWGRRLLNTQLASWAELRHDTILYAKQSYTSAASCEYPDAYVDPYPRFYAAVLGFAEHTLRILDQHGLSSDALGVEIPYDLLDPKVALYTFLVRLERVLENFVTVATVLQEMAEHQRTGAPHSEEHIAFINQLVQISTNCDGTPLGASGWYGGLFLDAAAAAQWAPTVADVHTQPTTPTGGDLGRVLHVATGSAQLMIASIESCSGPRAYAGVVSSYYEFTRDGWVRLNDEEWEEVLEAGEQPEPPEWARSLSTP